MGRVKKVILIILSVVLVCSVAALIYTYRKNAVMTAEQDALAAAVEEAKLSALAEAQASAAETPPLSGGVAASAEPEEDKPDGEDTAESPQPKVILPWLRMLYEVNSDLCGWLTIDDTVVNYPVMWTPEEPQRYLRLSFYGESAVRGSLFLDAACDPFEPSDNLIIYGHNMNNDTMFGALDEYADYDYWKAHSVIHFDTLYEEREYTVIAAFKASILKTDQEGFRYYRFFDADDSAEFDAYIDGIGDLALYDTGLSAEYGDELLTLSTCSYHTSNGRFVVVAVRTD